MTHEIDIRITADFGPEERERLFGWDADVFGITSQGRGMPSIEWRPKDIHVLLSSDNELVTHVGLLRHDVAVGDRMVTVAGIGGVVTHGDAQGKGYATRALEAAEEVMVDLLEVDFGLLFCFDHMVPFYQRLGWTLVTEPVTISQPSGTMHAPMNVMILALHGDQWPEGEVDLRSYPW